MTTHTPGLWHAVHRPDLAVFYIGTDDEKAAHNRLRMTEAGTTLSPVATVHTKAGGDPDPEDQGHAYLIAAAPLLLSACRDALATLDEMTTADFQVGGDRRIRAALASAVAQAEGRLSATCTEHGTPFDPARDCPDCVAALKGIK